jgi:hypothetical protein
MKGSLPNGLILVLRCLYRKLFPSKSNGNPTFIILNILTSAKSRRSSYVWRKGEFGDGDSFP